MKYCSAVKKNKFMKFASKLMDLEKIMLSELTKIQKDKHLTLLSFTMPNSK